MARLKRADIDVSTIAEKYIQSRVRGEGESERVKTIIVRSLLSDTLTVKQREYLILRYRQGMSCTEIAKIYGVNKATVSRTLSRARERIAKILSVKAVCEDFYRYLRQNAS